MVQAGIKIIIAMSSKPIGFQCKLSVKSPFKREIIDLVEPHEGQGILVTCLIIQTFILLFSIIIFEL